VGLKLDMVGIVVSNMKQALDFYRVLGLEIPENANEELHVEVKQGDFRLAFDTQEMAKEVYESWEAPHGHRIELAFLCESPDAIDMLYAKIINHGYVGYREPWNAVWGQRYAIVQDPDGNLLSLFA
jgi:uncharacterized glyoxalase superfamily protein PhnB